MSGPKLNTPPGFPTSGIMKRFIENPGLNDTTLLGSTESNDKVNSCINLVSLAGNICSMTSAAASPAQTFMFMSLQYGQQNIDSSLEIIIIIIKSKDLGGIMSKDLTNAKNSDKMQVRHKVRTEYLSDAIVGGAVEIRKTSDEQFRLQLMSKGRQ